MSGNNDTENGSSHLPSYKLTHRELHPSTRAIMAGYNSRLSERSVKPPLFRTSTFEFTNAEEGRQFFERAYHLAGDDGQDPGLIYSRLNNPNVEIWEDKMVAIENGAAHAAAFPSGMNAITTTVLALVPFGGRILYTDPVYGGTYFFFEHLGGRFGITATAVDTSDLAKVEASLKESSAPFDLIFLETPSNPSMTITDIEAVVALSRRHGNGKTLVAVDNTFLGPVFQQPFQQGADLVLYSATKFLGGHSDLIAGIVLAGEGSRGKELIGPIRDFRTVLGGTLAADTAWMLTRSLETCWLRMQRQAEKAIKVAAAIASHPKVGRVMFPGLLTEQDGAQYQTYRKQCSGPGSMITFFLKNKQREAAYKFLNAVKISHLAVSLGGTESLIEHPRTMTHSDMTDEALDRCHITDAMIRLSVGLESSEDLIHDLSAALDQS
jgi:methionine-gamma-lyase